MVDVPREVAESLEAARRSGRHNMLDYHGVHKWLSDHDHHAAVVWMAHNKSLYSQLLFEGMSVDGEEFKK